MVSDLRNNRSIRCGDCQHSVKCLSVPYCTLLKLHYSPVPLILWIRQARHYNRVRNGRHDQQVCHLKPSMYFQEALDVEPPYDVCGAAVAQLRTKRKRPDADVEHRDREHGEDGI